MYSTSDYDTSGYDTSCLVKCKKVHFLFAPFDKCHIHSKQLTTTLCNMGIDIKKPEFAACKQQGVDKTAQSDQHLSYSVIGKYHI